MARFVVTSKHLEVALSAIERRVLGRPNLKIELNRISDVSLGSGLKIAELGVKVSRSSIFSGILGEYRAGAKKIIVLSKSRAAKHLVITLKHPTIDEIRYSGKDMESLYQALTGK
jgi:hypothetical protein